MPDFTTKMPEDEESETEFIVMKSLRLQQNGANGSTVASDSAPSAPGSFRFKNR